MVRRLAGDCTGATRAVGCRDVDGFAEEQPVTSTADKNSHAIFERIGVNGSDRGHTLPVAPVT